MSEYAPKDLFYLTLIVDYHRGGSVLNLSKSLKYWLVHFMGKEEAEADAFLPTEIRIVENLSSVTVTWAEGILDEYEYLRIEDMPGEKGLQKGLSPLLIVGALLTGVILLGRRR